MNRYVKKAKGKRTNWKRKVNIPEESKNKKRDAGIQMRNKSEQKHTKVKLTQN